MPKQKEDGKHGESPEKQHFELERLPELVRKFSREKIEDYAVPDAGQNIILPPLIYNPTKDFVRARDESRGVMLASTVESGGKQYWLVEYMQMLGQGNSVSVFPSPAKRNALIAMLGENEKDMKVIEYHSHTVSTGDVWFDQFSSGDYKTIQGMLNVNPDYIHALFTPTHVLTLAHQETTLKLARSSNEANALSRKKFLKWQGLFNGFLQQSQ